MDARSIPSNTQPVSVAAPKPAAVLELLKPITWFPPMWAYACGAISVGGAISERWFYVAAGVLLAGPLVCGTSQAINDWFDRQVDAINEPHRVIPSGRVPGRWGLYIAIFTTLLSALVASMLGTTVFVASLIGLAFAWAYSAPPFRLKMNGWLGNSAVGFSYESLPWITAAAAALGTLPNANIMIVALLYGLGAHGIMTINDFKAMQGDRELGIRSLPIQLGARNAAITASAIMFFAQVGVMALLISNGLTVHAGAVAALLGAQLLAMIRFVRDPLKNDVWFSAVGVGLYVTGMMITAFALRSLTAV